MKTRPKAGSCFESATGTIALETDKQIKDAVIHSSQTALRIKCYKKVPILCDIQLNVFTIEKLNSTPKKNVLFHSFGVQVKLKPIKYSRM